MRWINDDIRELWLQDILLREGTAVVLSSQVKSLTHV